MNELVGMGFIVKNPCSLSGFSRSGVYYRPKKRYITLNSDLTERISEIIARDHPMAREG